MANSKLTSTDLQFNDAGGHTGILGFDSNEFSLDKPLGVSNGISSTQVTVSGSGQVVALASLSSLHVDALTTDSHALNGSTSGAITMQASATTTDYTITLPAAQAKGTLENDGSGGLTWTQQPRLVYAIQGCYLDQAMGNSSTLAMSAVSSVAGWGALEEYNGESYRTNSNTLTIPSGKAGWYRISFSCYHPDANISGTSGQNGLGTFRVGISLSSMSNDIEGIIDDATGSPDNSVISIVRKLADAETIQFKLFGSFQTNEDSLVHVDLTFLRP